MAKTSMTDEKKFYLTKEGSKKVKKEYEFLKELRANKTKGDVPGIWQSEDLNPEYLSFQEDLDFIEKREAELETIVKNAVLIKTPKGNKKKEVDLGARIALEVNGEKDEFIIVGTVEANPSLGRISNESPVGRALLGHKAGDLVVISSPIKTTYRIKKVFYS